MGLDLYCKFQEAGLPAPNMHMELLLGSDAESTGIILDVLGSLRPLAQQQNVPIEELGDFDALPQRIQAEVIAANTVISFIPLVGVWSRKPSSGSRPS
jgi:hypothetical protein